MSLETIKDINEAFLDVFLLEENTVRKSYEEGFQIGCNQGNPEGYHLGFHRGAELGAEIGYYIGVVTVYLKHYEEQKEKPEKILKSLRDLDKLLSEFPDENVEDIDILECADVIRARFKSMTKVVVQEYIDNIVKCLTPRLPLANFHMVDYFSTNVFKQFFSDVIIKEIDEISPQATIEAIFNNDLTKLPQLKMCIEEFQQFPLKHSDVCLSVTAFEDKLSKWNSEDIRRLKLNKFMNSKKSHEVDIMSYICAALCNTSMTSHLIDIGDGKGYLSSMLALHHKIPVLGIDCSQINTDGAVKRVQKLSRVWNGITDNKGNFRETSAHLYKQITLFVDETVDFPELISRVFLEKPRKIGIVGLHTCGNLASNSLRTFISSPSIKTICNVGCCYHLLDEPKCFPMSQYLLEKNFTLGRSARMIATQSYERIQNNRELPNKKIFYRALFEVLLNHEQCDLSKSDRQVGRFKKEISGFVEYVRKASARINVKIDKSDVELQKFYDEFKSKESELNLFYLLRGMLSPTIESLILLDRLLFLLENDLENSYLVQLFDPIISPRCYAVISMK